MHPWVWSSSFLLFAVFHATVWHCRPTSRSINNLHICLKCLLQTPMCGRRAAQFRQLVQCLQTQIVQKLPRGGQQGWPPQRFAVAHGFNPATIFQLLDDQAVHRNPPYVFNVTPRDWLAIGNDGHGLQRGACIPWRFFRRHALQIRPHLRARLETPARGHLHQLDPSGLPLLLQFQQQGLQRFVAQHILKQKAKIAQWQRLHCTKQSGFKDAAGIHGVHGSAFSRRRPVPACGTTDPGIASSWSTPRERAACRCVTRQRKSTAQTLWEQA